MPLFCPKTGKYGANMSFRGDLVGKASLIWPVSRAVAAKAFR